MSIPRLVGPIFGVRETRGYEVVDTTEELEVADHGSHTTYSQTKPLKPSTRISFFSALASILALFLGIAIGRGLPRNLDDICIKHTSNYSPLYNEVEIKFTSVEFDGRFKEENIYRQDAAPKVDEAWDSLGVMIRPMVISEDDGVKSGLTKDHVRRAEKHGGGYIVIAEGLHHLHCLNLLRKALWYNYDYYREAAEAEFVNDGSIFRWHVTHCLDVLRQRLMCAVDVGVFGQVWVNGTNGYPYTFPDFRTRHVCANFEDVRDWADRKQLPPNSELPDDYLEWPVDDVVVLPGAP